MDAGRLKSGRSIKACRGFQGEEGFTLAELMVAIFIIVIMLIAVGNMIFSGAQSSLASFGLVRLTDMANEAMSTMVRQIRVTVRLDPACTANAISFTGDIDGDGVDDVQRFDVYGGYLRRGPSAASMSNWIPNVNAVSFTYFWYNPATKRIEALTPGSAAWTTNRAKVCRVDISLSMSVQALRITVGRTFTGSVNLRNKLME